MYLCPSRNGAILLRGRETEIVKYVWMETLFEMYIESACDNDWLVWIFV